MNTRKIKQWEAETHERHLTEGLTTETALRESYGERFGALMRKVNQIRREREAWESGRAKILLHGRIDRETENAVLFAPRDGGPAAWLPRSQVEVLPRALGPLDGVNVPLWLATEKGLQASE